MVRLKSSPAGRVELELINYTRSPLPPRKLLEESARMALAPLERKARGRPLSGTLVCAGAGRMRKLNARFAGRAELTDVLAFPAMELDPAEGSFYVGDVVICRPVAVRQARARSLSVRGELVLYALHGWLHLAGYRDKTEKERRKMVRAERQIMKRIGLRRD